VSGEVTKVTKIKTWWLTFSRHLWSQWRMVGDYLGKSLATPNPKRTTTLRTIGPLDYRTFGLSSSLNLIVLVITVTNTFVSVVACSVYPLVTDICIIDCMVTAWMFSVLCRVPLMSSQDGGTASKASGVCSPAVALPHQAFYPSSGVNSPSRFGVTNYPPVMRGLPYKQVGATVPVDTILLLLISSENLYSTLPSKTLTL